MTDPQDQAGAAGQGPEATPASPSPNGEPTSSPPVTPPADSTTMAPAASMPADATPSDAAADAPPPAAPVPPGGSVATAGPGEPDARRRWLTVALAIGALVLVGGIGFAAGATYDDGQSARELLRTGRADRFGGQQPFAFPFERRGGQQPGDRRGIFPGSPDQLPFRFHQRGPRTDTAPGGPWLRGGWPWPGGVPDPGTKQEPAPTQAPSATASPTPSATPGTSTSPAP